MVVDSEVRRLELRIEELERELELRDDALNDAAIRTGGHLHRIETLEQKLLVSQSLVVELRESLHSAKRAGAESGEPPRQHAPVEPLPQAVPTADDGSPVVPGISIDGVSAESPIGTRYAAHEIGSGRRVGVMVFAKPLADLNGSRLDALLQARHPVLAAAIAFGKSRDRAYVVFEHAAGETLEEWVDRAGPASETAALRIALQVARGLREAAFHGALHGDLSPRVVRIAPSGDVKIEDTGLGELDPAADRPAHSPDYAAPERLRPGRPADLRADIFSFGAVLHFLLTAQAPFGVAADRTGVSVPDPRGRRPALSPESSAAVMTLLAPDPNRRPATWDEALVLLERIVPADDEADEEKDAEPVEERTNRIADLCVAHPVAACVLAAAPIVAAALWLFFRK